MPEFGIFKEISVGGITPEDLLRRLNEAGVRFNDYAQALFSHPDFSPAKPEENLALVKVSLADLELVAPCSYQNIVARGSAAGLAPCPLYCAAFLRLAHLDQPVGPYLTVVSPPLGGGENDPTGFYIRNFDHSFWLRGYRALGVSEWPPNNAFVFQKKT